MFKQLSPRGVIPPLNCRNTVPGPSYVRVPEHVAFHENDNHSLSGHPGTVWV